jgi:hypothetical protein
MDNKTEPPLTEAELAKWQVKVAKLNMKQSLSGRGIQIELNENQKRRWIRCSIQKSRAHKISSEKVNKCVELLEQGCSIRQIAKQQHVGSQFVTQLRMKMRHGDIQPAIHIDTPGPSTNR